MQFLFRLYISQSSKCPVPRQTDRKDPARNQGQITGKLSTTNSEQRKEIRNRKFVVFPHTACYCLPASGGTSVVIAAKEAATAVSLLGYWSAS